MLSASKIKRINSLRIKKYRDESGLFVAEGTKLVSDILPHFTCRWLIATDDWLNEHHSLQVEEIIVMKPETLKKISGFKTPPQVLAVFEKPDYSIPYEQINGSLTLALDEVQDPGNVGTIIRLADWFGIENIVCSENTADIFNPKTLQASMGAVARVKVHYAPLARFFEQLLPNLPVFGTFLDGANIYRENLPERGVIVMGNEGNGISKTLERDISQRLYIPNFPAGRESSESLNVAIATAIVCSEFRRR